MYKLILNFHENLTDDSRKKLGTTREPNWLPSTSIYPINQEERHKNTKKKAQK